MAQSLAEIVIHLIFSTKDRVSYFRDRALRDELHHFLGGVLKNFDCPSLIVGGAEDHVHVLCLLARTRDQASVVKEIKRASSIWLKTKAPELQDFSWQAGYGAFSVGHSQIESVRKYIAGLEEHHRNVSFQEEYRQFLSRHEIAFDERYVWD
jgi:putative transposase